MDLTELKLDEANAYPVRHVSAILQCASSLFLVPKETIMNGKNEVVLTHSTLLSADCKSLLSSLVAQNMTKDTKRSEVKVALRSLNDGTEHNQVKKLQTKLNIKSGEYDKVLVEKDHWKEKFEKSDDNCKIF